MVSITKNSTGSSSSPPPSLGNPIGIILRYVGLLFVDAFAIWFVTQLIADEAWFLAVLVGVVTFGLNVFFLSERFYAFRWFSPGLALMVLMVIYPTIFTIYVAFTNYGQGHLFTQPQVIPQIESETYIPEDGIEYDVAVYRSPDSTQYLLWLIDADGNVFAARPAEALIPNGEGVAGVGALDEDGFPETIEGYERLNRIELASDDQLETLTFGTPENSVGVSGGSAARYEQRYVYDSARNMFTDQQTGTEYIAVNGIYTSTTDPEDVLSPGYYATIGLENFVRFFTSSALRGPLTQVFIWTLVHAFLAVLLTFVLGLAFALVFNSDLIIGKKILRSFILIPYAMPAFISVLIWRGLLSEQLGPISVTMRDWFGWSPPWFSDGLWARIGVLVVQLWLGFPYMMLICTGALQSIASEIYEAAEVDGATAWQRFWRLTLPLLLVAVGPILIASFAFNFNNFGVIRLYNSGGPPIPNTTTPAGYTDILISYTYRLAFNNGQGADYGLASAITIIIFAIVLTMTVINFRFTRTWEEVSENV